MIYYDIEDITTEDEEYDRHSNHIYSKHRRRRRNTTDFVDLFVERQISRSQSFLGQYFQLFHQLHQVYSTLVLNLNSLQGLC